MAKNKERSEIENIERLINDKGVQFRDFREYKIETRKTDEGQDSLIVTGKPVVFDSRTFLFHDSWDGYDVYEEIDPHAFDEADMDDVIFNYNHCGRVFARSRKGKGNLQLDVEDEYMSMEAELWADDEGHRQLHRDIDRGIIDKMSFAFSVEEVNWIENEEKHEAVRRITKVKRLFDVSAVDIPAYDATEISARSAAIPERRKLQSERRAAASRSGNDAAKLEMLERKLLKAKLGGNR